MSLTSHIEELRKKHQTLSETVEREQRKPSVDAMAVTSLKKEKLRLKQEIERLSAS